MSGLVVSIPRGEAGNTAWVHLQEAGQRDLGVGYRQALHTRLSGLQSGLRLMALDHTFHRLEVEDGLEAAAINRIMSWHNGEGGRGSLHGRVDAVEPDLIFQPSATLGLPFHPGGLHQTYLQLMKVDDAHRAGVDGKGITVAVVDSGADAGMKKPVDDFYDIQSGNPVHPGAHVDHDGHGTAMATLVQEVAPEAKVVAIRVFDEDKLNLWNVLAGTGTAVFDCNADIVSISLGYTQMPSRCGVCGASAQSRSLAFQYLLEGIARTPGQRGSPPLYVAATGNDYSSGGFNYPAAYDSAVAIGSVTGKLGRSAFSNYGKKNPKYFFDTGRRGKSARICAGGCGRGRDRAMPWNVGGYGLRGGATGAFVVGFAVSQSGAGCVSGERDSAPPARFAAGQSRRDGIWVRAAAIYEAAGGHQIRADGGSARSQTGSVCRSI
jgi:hypothetical protein